MGVSLVIPCITDLLNNKPSSNCPFATQMAQTAAMNRNSSEWLWPFGRPSLTSPQMYFTPIFRSKTGCRVKVSESRCAGFTKARRTPGVYSKYSFASSECEAGKQVGHSSLCLVVVGTPLFFGGLKGKPRRKTIYTLFGWEGP